MVGALGQARAALVFCAVRRCRHELAFALLAAVVLPGCS